jgi:hypothetical protein
MNPFRIYVNGKCDTFVNADHILKADKIVSKMQGMGTSYELFIPLSDSSKKGAYLKYEFENYKYLENAFDNLFVALSDKDNIVSFDGVERVEKSW